jgi:hypothetical protein
MTRSSRCEWRRSWTIGRLTGCLPNPVTRHVGDHVGADKPQILPNARLPSGAARSQDDRKSRQPPLSHFGRPSVASFPAVRARAGPTRGRPWTDFTHLISRCSPSGRLPRPLSPVLSVLPSASSRLRCPAFSRAGAGGGIDRRVRPDRAGGGQAGPDLVYQSPPDPVRRKQRPTGGRSDCEMSAPRPVFPAGLASTRRTGCVRPRGFLETTRF